MKTFKKKNKLGIEFDCAIVAKTKYKSEVYVVYTNFVTNDNDEFMYSVGKLVDGNVIDIEYKLAKAIINEFFKSKLSVDRLMEEMK